MFADTSVVAISFPADGPPPPCDGRLRELHAYWRAIHPDERRLPGRRHFDPIAIPSLLQWIWLVDIHREPLRFKYRLVGTIHVEAAGWDPTGRWLDEAHPDFVHSSAYPQFRACAEDAEICFYRGPPTYVIKKDYVLIERFILPLAGDGHTVDMVLGITVLNPSMPPLPERSLAKV